MSGKELKQITFDLKDENNGLEFDGERPNGTLTIYKDGSILVNSKFDDGSTYIKLPNETTFEKDDKSIGSYENWKTDGNGTIIQYLVDSSLQDYDFFIIPNYVKYEDGTLEKIKSIGIYEGNSNSTMFSSLPIKHLIISEGIENLNSGVFMRSSFESINLPSSLKYIGRVSISQQTLKNIVLPHNLKEIGIGAFQMGTIEGKIIIPQNIEEIKNFAFKANSINEVFFEDNIKIQILNSGIFMNNKIEKILIPNSIKEIGINAFKDNPIKEVVIPASVIEIGSRAFESTTTIEKVTIEGDATRFNDTWTSIGFPAELMPSE